MRYNPKHVMLIIVMRMLLLPVISLITFILDVYCVQYEVVRLNHDHVDYSSRFESKGCG